MRPMFASVLISAIVSTAIAFSAVNLGLSGQAQPVAAKAKESAHDRVIRTGTLRCGYALLPVLLERDPNTGAFSGVYHTLVQEVGRQTGLKIEWTEEVGFANAFDGLKSGRYDALCSPFTPTPGRARVAEFTMPFAALPYYMYSRADDRRFDRDYSKVNHPEVKVAFLEGEMAQTVQKEDFSNATGVSLTNMTDYSQVLLQVATGKADVAMTEPMVADLFIAKNPGKLQRVPGAPVRMEPFGLVVPVGESALKSLLNTTIETMIAVGFVEKTLAHAATGPELYFIQTPAWRSVSPR
ncbi:MAG: transporter substrate-binding domain-containing protein [Alphaproteobacteria bacterium]|nr:MAG: transporter substrate-binding domain-containing protein [Alphaproteobacteria bacterium]